MQTEQKNNIDYVSEGVTSSGFNIAVNSTMFQMLTSNIYSKPKLAVMREWSTNACDACIGAGKDVVYDVHLPTKEECTFFVRDYGTGLSPENVLGLFSTLGESTKRNSDNLNGCFGIGRMAGLAVADAFTVDSFYKGMHYSYAVSINNGEPSILNFGSTPTEELDGLKLSVAVPSEDIPIYLELASELYTYFDHKPKLNVKVDIESKVGLFRNDDWYIEKTTDGYKRSANKVVLSQVVYDIPKTDDIDMKGLTNIIIKALPNTVSFNPGRETLSLDTKTVKYLNFMFDKISKDFEKQTKELLELTTSDVEAVTNFYTMRRSAGSAPLDAEILHNCVSKYTKTLLSGRNLLAFPDTDFYHLSGNLLDLSYKSSYYSTTRCLNAWNAVSIDSFMGMTHIIVDVKTNYKRGIADAYSNNNYILWQRQKGKDIDAAVKVAKEFLEGMGLPYIYASSLVQPANKKTEKREQPLYACSVSNAGTISTSRHITSEKMNKGKILYFNLSNTTPILQNNNVSIKQYMRLFTRLNLGGEEVKGIYGVPKKYQSYVSKLDNWENFETYFNRAIKGKKLFTNAEVELPFKDVSKITKGVLPDLPECILNFVQKYRKYDTLLRQSSQYISSDDELVPVLKELGAVVEPYFLCTQEEIDSLFQKYPTVVYIIDNLYSLSILPPIVYQRLVMLEDSYYETRKAE